MSHLSDKYINPLTDFGFKKLFGSEPNKDLLIDFLNQILPNSQIEDLSYAQNEHLGSNELDRKAIFDLYCIGKNGERFIVEMQKAKQNYFKDRSLYYISFPIQEQAKKGNWNYKLEAVYSIGILDFVFEDLPEGEVLHDVSLKDQNNKVFYDKLKFIYIELPKFKKKESDLVTHLDKWLYVFTHLSDLEKRPKALQERVLKKLFETAEIAKFSRAERTTYEKSLKYYRDIQNVADTSKEEGRLEGIEEGRLEGIEEEKERSENKEKNTIIRMYKAGMSLEQIADLLNISIKKAEYIVKQHQNEED
ncbi:MAG: Rpn family recombination-promoting nuclease/putative transposase [Chitinophagales bacterium]